MYISPIERLITLLTQDKCTICNFGDGPICETCFIEISEDTASRCYKCNKLTKQNKVCKSCKSSLRRVWWVGPYDTILKDLINKMKLGRNRLVARQVGDYFSNILPYIDSSTIVVPVPTAQVRVRRRGFDHAVILAQHIADSNNLPYLNILCRIGTTDQIGKRRRERIDQMKNSFRLKKGLSVEGKSILLVDDVITTGATIESAASLLRRFGAKHVDAVVVSRHTPK